MLSYLKNLLIALDQLVTALLGGWPDETLSSYAYRLDQNGRLAGRIFRPAIDLVFQVVIGQDAHCRQAVEAELDRRQLPPALRASMTTGR